MTEAQNGPIDGWIYQQLQQNQYMTTLKRKWEKLWQACQMEVPRPKMGISVRYSENPCQPYPRTHVQCEAVKLESWPLMYDLGSSHTLRSGQPLHVHCALHCTRLWKSIRTYHSLIWLARRLYANDGVWIFHPLWDGSSAHIRTPVIAKPPQMLKGS